MPGIDSNTVLMLHCDGTDASTTFTDSSATGHTMTANGDVQIDTAQQKFGTASGLFDGTGDYLTTLDHADFTFGNGDFTIDFWYRPAAVGKAMFYSQSTNGSTQINFYRESTDNKLYFYVTNGGVFQAQYSTAWTPTVNTWYHIALVRNGSTILIFIDGVSKSLTVINAIGTSTNPDFTGVVAIGKDSFFNSYFINGWIDEYRVSKGIARWTSDFTPPTAAYDSNPTAVIATPSLAKVNVLVNTPALNISASRTVNPSTLLVTVKINSPSTKVSISSTANTSLSLLNILILSPTVVITIGSGIVVNMLKSSKIEKLARHSSRVDKFINESSKIEKRLVALNSMKD